jgi:DNA-binding transcriptional LysR family regulator
LELRQLRYFMAVAEELHFRRAAERLYVAQSAISAQIRKLESELGMPLLDRTERGVTLTPAGSALRDEARGLLRQAEALPRAARAAREATAGRLKLGYASFTIPRAVPLALERFRDTAPGIDVVLETGTSLRMIAEVRAGRLDAAVVCLPAPVGGLRITGLGVEPAIAATPAGPGEEPVTLEQLERTRLVVPPRDANPAFYDAIIAACREADISPSLAHAAQPEVEHLLLSVAAGLGIALLPASVGECHVFPGVRFRSLATVLPIWEAVVVSQAESASTTTAAFLRAAAIASRPAAIEPLAASRRRA